MSATTALLVIDVQVNQFDPPYAVHEGDALLGRVRTLIDRARAAGSPVFFVRNCGGEVDPDQRGTPGWELHPSLVPNDGEPVLDKTTCDTFESTGIDAELKARGVKDLVIAGLQSNWCIRETSLGAVARGWPVTLIENAHSTFSDGPRTAPEISAAVNEELRGKVKLAKAEDLVFDLPGDGA